MKFITVPGTHATEDDPRGEWWFPGAPGYRSSPFLEFLARFGLEPLRPEEPFSWSGDVDLLDIPLLRGRRNSDWHAGGDALRYYLEDVPLEDRNIIAHSHGRQVVLYAARKLEIRSLVVVCGPVRHGLMTQIANEARPHIHRWLHIYDPGWDWWQRLGELFDGAWGLGRAKDTWADVNAPVKGNGHSGVLVERDLIRLWALRGWIEWMRTGAPVDGAVEVARG